MRTSIDNLANEIMKNLEDYANLANKDMKEAVTKSAKVVKDNVQSNAPKDTGAYSKSWTTKKTKETSNSLELTVHSKDRYQLTHLLENGHAKRNGGRVAAKVHIAPAEQAGIRELENEIVRSLQNG